MSEIEEFQEQLEELVKSIQVVIDNELPKLRGAERAEKCSYLKNRLVRAKQVHRSIIVEMRDLDSELVAQWKNRTDVYEGILTKLVQDVDWAETAIDKEALSARIADVERMSAKQITTQALAVQEKTQVTTSKIKAVLEETVEIGAVTANELKRQGEQIGHVQQNVEIVETNIKRANKQLLVFVRRLATDKIFILFIFLIVVGVIGGIVLYALKANGVVKF